MEHLGSFRDRQMHLYVGEGQVHTLLPVVLAYGTFLGASIRVIVWKAVSV